MAQVAKLHGEEEGEQEELQLYDIQDDGRGRLDWTAAERAFDARLLKIKGRGPPGVFPSGDREGLTRDTFQPGSVLPVTVYRKQDGKWSLQELLSASLPNILEVFGSSRSMTGRDPDRKTHPTEVEDWPDWEIWAKDVIRTKTSSWQEARYDRTGEKTGHCVNGEPGFVSVLEATACGRLNIVFIEQGIDYRFVNNLSTRPTDSQVAAIPPEGIQLEPEEVRGHDIPDMCLVKRSGPVRSIVQTTECKTKFRLAGVENSSMATIWNAYRKGSTAGDPAIAQNVVRVIAQELGYMARRGLRTGIITTYLHTWLLQTDGLGHLKISPAIRHDTLGTPTTASVTEACLASAVFNLYDTDRKRYTTAKKPGEKPITTDEDLSVRNQAEEELLPKPEQPAVSSQRGGYNLRSTSRPFNELHLTTRLAPNVFLGGVAGRAAAVRLAVSPAAIEDAKREAAVYEQLEHLQGRCVPRLLAHGPTLKGGAYFVATEYVKGQAWDWNARAHQALDQDLREALAMIHRAGVVHGDLHKGNILVTPDDRVIILDFEGSQMHADPKQMASEMEDVTSWQAMRVCVR